MWCDLLVFLSDGNVSHFEGWDREWKQGVMTKDPRPLNRINSYNTHRTIQTTIFNKNRIVRMTNWVFNFGVNDIQLSPQGLG